jgi:DNA invertase Pin-like site-specific DNA recombinase
MQRIYGYCRISTKKQNILAAYPTARITKETYTGTKLNRRGLEKILREVQKGDTIVFDSVSRMSRNAAEGIEIYMQLYDKGVELVFLKEPHINTVTYKQALSNSVELVGNEIADIYIEATNKVLRLLATKQIELAFGQAQKEVDDLHQRTAEGIETAHRNGKRIGTPKGSILNVKKKAPAMEFIAKHSHEFGGELNDTQCAAAAKICRKTFYKYKEELRLKFESEEPKITL